MEVHPPEHPIRNWRDFFIHIATIVIGLLIAIGLEQTVEWVHHRHLVETAHRDLRDEMMANSRTVEEDQRKVETVRQALLHDLGNLRGMQAGKAPVQVKITASWSWDGLSESAFNTAKDTGAFALMPYEEVHDIDTVYRQQQLAETAAKTYILAVNRIRAPLQGGRGLSDVSADEQRSMVESCSEALLDIDLLEALMRPLPRDYTQLTTH